MKDQDDKKERSVAEFIELLENDDYFEKLKKSSIDDLEPLKKSFSLSEALSFDASIFPSQKSEAPVPQLQLSKLEVSEIEEKKEQHLADFVLKSIHT